MAADEDTDSQDVNDGSPADSATKSATAGSAPNGGASKEADAKPPQIGAAKVALNVVNTIELQCDKHDSNWTQWYDQGAGMHRVWQGNDVRWMIDGENTFPEMIHAINTAEAGHYIYILGWILQLGFKLNDVPADPKVSPLDSTCPPFADAVPPAPESPGVTLNDLLLAANNRGVEIRVMLWDQPMTTNTQEVEDINKLSKGAAILDNRTLNFGSHHQKVLVVNGREGLIAFCGGVDINEDRVHALGEELDRGTPYNDVHCRIKGPAASDLLLLFRQRWKDHPDVEDLPKDKQSLLGDFTPVPPAADNSKPRQYVQIGRTFGNGANNAGIGGIRPFTKGYSFAPNGEQTAWRIVQHAVKQAKEFIYLEDQYLISMPASNLLRDQLGSIKKLVILIPHSYIVTDAPLWARRKAFIDNLMRGGNADKVAVCVRFPFREKRSDPRETFKKDWPRTYVHTKTWIIDDKFAIIGSANCNNRGYTHDSEVNAGIYDESRDAPCTLHFAHKLRMHLWAKHLHKGAAEVFDPIASSIFWFSTDPAVNENTNIALYDRNADTDDSWHWRTLPKMFPNLVDPDGS